LVTLFRGLGTDKRRKLWHIGLRSRTVAAEVLAKDSEFVEYLVALLIVDFRIKRRRLDSRVGMRGWRLETNVADIEIFLEAIELEEIGEFHCADISALCTDLLLEISDDAL
jgi:hypothetical protein